MLMSLVRQIVVSLKDERGIETLEWILIGALITGVAVVIYPGGIQTALNGAVTYIAANITGAA